jgi:hypothetical protein
MFGATSLVATNRRSVRAGEEAERMAVIEKLKKTLP